MLLAISVERKDTFNGYFSAEVQGIQTEREHCNAFMGWCLGNKDTIALNITNRM